MSQGGDSPSLDSTIATLPTSTPQSFASPKGAAMNDFRLGARLVLVQQSGSLPAVSVAYSVWFPSGNPSAYTGTGVVRHAPSLIVGADTGRFVWSVMAGRRVQDSQKDEGLIGSEILTGASFAARFGKLTTHGELFGTVTTADKAALASAKPSLELLFGARYALGPLSAGIMGGPGLFRGIGSPTFRALATIGGSFDLFGKTNSSPTSKLTATSNNTAQDSIKKGDVIPPKDLQTISPPAVTDRDRDSVPDAQDACPEVPGDASATAVKRGCPADRDGDGIADANDRCPDEKGVAAPDPERFGCPFDTDGDGFVDAVDACPNEKGEANADPKKQGCPKSVRLEGMQIVILQEVNFATGSDKISPDSFALLDQVAAVLKQHPEIARLAVDGHTDNVGSEKANLTLSQKRAVAVVGWLADHGIDTRRLEARGFGPRRPLVPNTTPEAKAKNRRVEFQILKRSTDGEASWRPGSIQ
jgi:OmpA-OmpF porin, OOP family